MQPIRDTGVYSSTAPVRSGLFGVVSAFVCVCVSGGYIAGACVTSRTMVAVGGLYCPSCLGCENGAQMFSK